MKKSMFLTVLSVFMLNICVQSQNWTSIKLPEVSGKWTLTGINFPSANNGWAVGYNYEGVGFAENIVKGVIIHYKDGQWINADYPSPSGDWTLHGVWFLNDKEGWAFGQNKENKSGLLMHFQNDVWTVVDLSVVKSKEWILYDVYFLNAGLGWAVGGTLGNDKPVLLTFKDGAWKQEDVADFKKQTLLAVQACKNENVFIGGFREGEFGKIGVSRPQGSFIMLNTKGAWETCKVPLLSNNVLCRDIVCIDENNVYAVGWMPAFQSAPETGKILFYNGKKWSDMSVDACKEWNLMGIAFESANAGWGVGNCKDKGLLVEFNKGNWEALGKKTEPQVSEKWNLHSIAYDGQGSYYAAGGDEKSNKGLILKKGK